MGGKTDKKGEHRKKIEPRWKRRIEEDIYKLRQEVSFLERKSKEELGRENAI